MCTHENICAANRVAIYIKDPGAGDAEKVKSPSDHLTCWHVARSMDLCIV